MMVEQVVLQPCISTKTAWAVRGWGLLAPFNIVVSVKLTLDWTMDWTMNWNVDSILGSF